MTSYISIQAVWGGGGRYIYITCSSHNNYYDLDEKSTINNSSIIFSFADLAIKVAENLSAKKIRPGDLRLLLKCRLGCGDIISGISCVRKMIETVTEKKYWDYYNYHALEGIIKHFAENATELLGRMEDHKTKLTAFKTTTKIADYIKECTKDELMVDGISKMKYDKEFNKELSFKLRDSKDSILKINEKCLSYIDNFWNDISDQFHLPPLPILLAKIRGGCIEVTWFVPASIACIINKLSQESNEFYQQHGVVRVMINNEVLYNEDGPSAQVWVDYVDVQKCPTLLFQLLCCLL